MCESLFVESSVALPALWCGECYVGGLHTSHSSLLRHVTCSNNEMMMTFVVSEEERDDDGGRR